MYTRDFTRDVHIPDAYGGTAFEEGGESAECLAAPEKEEPSVLSKLFSKGWLSGIKLPFAEGHEFKIGTEEILIISLAAFLFFSKDGDRECALMLLALLFIS